LPMFGMKRPHHTFHNGYSGQMMHQVPTLSQGNYEQQNFRNQPIPYQGQPMNYDWMGYQQQNHYYPQSMQTYGQNYQPGYIPQNMPYPNPPYIQKDAQFLFQNPLQPKEEIQQQQPHMPTGGYPMMNPYPKNSFVPKQPGGMQSIMNSFKSQDGSVDINKMVNTAGQMMNAVSQVSSLVKGLGGIFKV